MNPRLLPILVLCGIFSLPSHAQYAPKNSVTIDTTRMVCMYDYHNYSALNDIMEKEMLMLEIGREVSKCYSYDTYVYDSLFSTPQGRQIIQEKFADCLKRSATASGKEQTAILLEIPSRRSECIVFKHYPAADRMLVHDVVSRECYKYTESMQQLQQWELTDETMEILGFLCTKATTKWRGRNYTAWFTPEVPISDGPHKFCGLPGLIVKVEDSDDGHYLFELKGIQQIAGKEIYISDERDGKPYQEGDRKELLRMQKQSLKNQVRRANRDMQRTGNPARVSEDRVDTMERE